MRGSTSRCCRIWSSSPWPAAGISGAIQHRVGVEGADMIVAINTDAGAPIFSFAHIGVVADATTILPALTEAFRRRLAVNRLAS
jgi:electron transfer flavoprotein alpha subunit